MVIIGKGGELCPSEEVNRSLDNYSRLCHAIKNEGSDCAGTPKISSTEKFVSIKLLQSTLAVAICPNHFSYSISAVQTSESI